MTRRRPTHPVRRRARHARARTNAARTRDPSITRLGFTCYRLVTFATGGGPSTTLFARLQDPRIAMSAFVTA